MPSNPLAVTRSTSADTCAARWAGSASSGAMAGPRSVSVTVGITLMPLSCRAVTTVASPAPVFDPIVVAPVASYQNGEASAHRSALSVTDFSELVIDQYGSQP